MLIVACVRCFTSTKMAVMTAAGLYEVVRDGDITVAAFTSALRNINEVQRQHVCGQLEDLAETSVPPWMIVDLTDVEYFGSSFVQVLLRVWARICSRDDARFAVIVLQKNCRMEITQVDREMPVFATRAEAIAALSSQRSESLSPGLHSFERRVDAVVACPSEETLRCLISNATQETNSTDLQSHMANCPTCLNRIAAWDEQLQFEPLMHAVERSDIVVQPASENPASNEAESVTKILAAAVVRKVGQYELLRKIGTGGGGDVFEARHTLLKKRVAIKLLKEKHSGDKIARQRFFREIESIGKLDDPHIVRPYDAGEADGAIYLAMELVNVESLARRLGPMPIAGSCEIIRQAALGLQHVHECGLVHRDLKPSNLLMSENGVKISDMGLALLSRSEPIDERLTSEHTVLGTADYMAPEQAEGSHDVDIRADVYSLGCTLFRLLAGHPPFVMPESSSLVKKMWAHASYPIPNIRQIRPDVPPELANIVTKLMAKDRHDRFAEPSDLAEALIPFCVSQNIQSLIRQSPIGPLNLRRDSTALDPTDSLSNPAAARRATAVQPQSAGARRTPAIAAAVVIVCVLAALGRRGSHEENHANKAEEPHAKLGRSDSSNTLPLKSSPLPSIPLVHDLKTEKDQLAVIAIPPNRVTRQWQAVFGIRPADVIWPGRTGMGGWRLDDDQHALVIHTNRTIRLVQLGELHPGAIGKVRLGVDVSIPSEKGSFGFFLGYRQHPDDHRRAAEFQVVEVLWLKNVNSMRRVTVRRCLCSINSENGAVNSERTDFVGHGMPALLDKFRMEIHVENDRIANFTFAGLDCPELCTEQLNSQFLLDDYCGAFGVFGVDSIVEFRNPSFARDP